MTAANNGRERQKAIVKKCRKTKIKIMKKIILMAIAAVSLAACNDNAGENTSVDSRDTSTGTVTTTLDGTSGDTSNDTSTTASSGYVATEGDVTYRDRKVKVMRNREWVDADDDVKLDDGVVVYRSGRVKRDNKEIELEEGQVVTKTGNFFDKTGRAIENAWDATKEGVKDAGSAIKKAGKKTKEKAKDAVTDDDNQ